MSNEALKQEILGRFRSHDATVAVVGLGYVGLPFAVEKAKVGFRVQGIDQNSARVAQVNRGENYIPDIADEDLRRVVDEGRMVAVDKFDAVAQADAIVICVPTPLTEDFRPDLQYVESVGREIGQRLRRGQLVSLESTTYPGTTEEILQPLLEESGLVAGEDFYLAHSPERVDPGNKRYTTKNTNKLVGGVGLDSLEVATAFYQQTIETVVPVSSAKVAEMAKVYENTYRAVNIALVNEMAMLCDRMGLDVWDVLDAAFTKPFGIQAFYPGPGVGGHCIPIDPHYLEWKARELDFETRFIRLAGETNRGMPAFVVDKAARVLERNGQSMTDATIGVLGVAYKKDLADCRESPVLDIIRQILRRGGRVVYHDPHVPDLHSFGFDLEHQGLDATTANADLVILATDHSALDRERIVAGSRCILDARNALRDIADPEQKVVRL